MGLPKAAQDFIEKLLVVNPVERLSASDALAHPFIADRKDTRQEHVDSNVVDALVNFALTSKLRRVFMYFMAWSLTDEDREKVRAAFENMDESREGTISLGELRKTLTARTS